MLRWHYFSSPPSTLKPFVFFSEAAAVSEDTPSALLCREDISTFYGQTHPLAGDAFKAWLSRSIALKASLLRLLLQLKGKASLSLSLSSLLISSRLVSPLPPWTKRNNAVFVWKSSIYSLLCYTLGHNTPWWHDKLKRLQILSSTERKVSVTVI